MSKEIFLAYSTHFVFSRIRLVLGNVVMVVIDNCRKSPITEEWIYGITWKHVYFSIFVVFMVYTTSILKLAFPTTVFPTISVFMVTLVTVLLSFVLLLLFLLFFYVFIYLFLYFHLFILLFCFFIYLFIYLLFFLSRLLFLILLLLLSSLPLVLLLELPLPFMCVGLLLLLIKC